MSGYRSECCSNPRIWHYAQRILVNEVLEFSHVAMEPLGDYSCNDCPCTFGHKKKNPCLSFSTESNLLFKASIKNEAGFLSFSKKDKEEKEPFPGSLISCVGMGMKHMLNSHVASMGSCALHPL